MDKTQARNPLFVVGLALVFTWTHTATGFLRTDAGLGWVAVFYLCLSVFMVGLVFLDKRDAKTRGSLSPTGLVSGVCLMLAPLALGAAEAFEALPTGVLLAFACIAGSYGIAHSYRSWSTPISHMPALCSCVHVAKSLVLSVLVELFCYLVGFSITCLVLAAVGLAIPFVLNACYSKMDAEDLESGLVSHDFMTNVKAAMPLWRIVVGISVFSFAMGVSWTLLLSNPSYNLALTDFMTEGIVLVLVGCLSLVSVKITQRVSFSLIWRCIVLLMSAAILVSPQVDGLVYEFVVSLVRAAQSIMAVLWFLTLTDISRKMRIDASHVIGMGWVFYSLPIAAGVLFGLLLVPINPLETVLPALTVLALVAVTFIVDDRDLEQDLFFSDMGFQARQLASTESAARPDDAESQEDAPHEQAAGEPAGPCEPETRKTRTYTADPQRREAEVVLPAHKHADDGMGSGRRDKLSVRCVAIARDYNLTNREFDVLVRLAHGRSGAYIAQELTLSENTVKGHAKRLYAKLGVHTRQELINMAEEYKFKD